jgi:hypothetical protein
MAEGEIAQPPPTNADGGNDANQSKNDESKQHPRGRMTIFPYVDKWTRVYVIG